VQNGSDKEKPEGGISWVSPLLLLIININYNTVNYCITVLMENSFVGLRKSIVKFEKI
jgi:hypothetical protein